MESIKTPDQEKQSYLKKAGNLNLAKEAVDLNDHAEVMKMNRDRLREDLAMKSDASGTLKTDFNPLPKTNDDVMHVGDKIETHYHNDSKKESDAGRVPEYQYDNESLSKKIGKGALSAIPWILTAVALGFAGSQYFQGKKEPAENPDYVNMPIVSVEGDLQEPMVEE